MTYAEYLKSQGAAPEEIAILDTPTARRVFDAQQREMATITADRDKFKRAHDETQDWFRDVQTPEWNTLQNDLIKAKARAATFETALRTAEDRGLLNITKDLGIDPEEPPTPNNPARPAAPAIDTSKFVSMEDARKMAQQEREAILIAQDIAAEHATLFPGQRLSFLQLGREAAEAKQTVQQFWMNKYKVEEARAKQAADIQAAHDKKVAEDAVKAAREEWSRQYGSNPDVRQPVASHSSLTIRKAADGTTVQPWAQGGEDTLSNNRVARALERARMRESGQTVQ